MAGFGDSSRIEVGCHCPESDIGESAFEHPHGFLPAAAAAHSSVNELTGAWVVAGLSESDPMQGCVELSIACPAEPVTVVVARPDR
jgi:hypothetical protein